MFRDTALVEVPSGITFKSAMQMQRTFQDCPYLTVASGISLDSMVSGVSLFLNAPLTKTTYSDILARMAANNPNNSVPLNANLAKYNLAGKTARDILTASPRSWSITDGGYEPF